MLTQETRVEISKKIVSIPLENIKIEETKQTLLKEKTIAQKADNANADILSKQTLLINKYQIELGQLDGNIRSVIVEQDILDTVNQKIGNYFSPNDINNKPPSLLPTGIWKGFFPFSGNKAIGKEYLEVFPSTIQGENSIISEINSKITTLESYPEISRCTGQSCVNGGVCSLPQYTVQQDCIDGGGVWTIQDVISNNPTIQTLCNEIVALVTSWKDRLNTELNNIPTTDTIRNTENQAAINNINAIIPVIETWQALGLFDANHGQTTCVGFYSYNVANLNPTKFRAVELLPLKNILSSRGVFATNRTSEVAGWLGNVTQNMETGDVSVLSGLYGVRYGILNVRLNLINGSARRIRSLEMAYNAQNDMINSNNLTLMSYAGIVRVEAVVGTPMGDGYFIPVKSVVGWNVGDSVFIKSNSSVELSCDIIEVKTNGLIVSKKISVKYSGADGGRIYKDLT